MYFKNFLAGQNAQNQIDGLSKALKNKKIVIYGAGEFSKAIFKNYDLSKLNILAVADKKYKNGSLEEYWGYKTISPKELATFDCEYVLVANYDTDLFIEIVKDLVRKKSKKIKVLPLIKKERRKLPFDWLFKFISTYATQEKQITPILNLLAKISTLHILNKKDRKIEIIQKKFYIQTRIYGYQCFKVASAIGENFWCGGFSYVTPNTIIKDNVNFNGMRIMGGGNVTIGRYFHSGIENLIITQNHNYDNGNAIPYDNTYVYKDVEIGDFVWFGSRVMILPGTKIGEGAIIQGGSVVHGEIPPYAIAGGNPAKVFKYRDIEHFKKLKAEGKFY